MAAAFKSKPLAPEELTAALKVGTSHIPRTTGEPATPPTALLPVAVEAPTAGKSSRERPPKVVQINFACTPAMARVIAQLSEATGSVRVMFANLLRDQGHEIPHWDLKPFSNRRQL